MKEIRRITEAVSMDQECQDENNNESKLSPVTSEDKNESGFFHLAVRPLLAPGHESELIYFIQNIGLIKQFIDCNICDKSMKWTPSRCADFFQWKCSMCNSKSSIRMNSPFNEIKCTFKNILLTLLAWTNNEDIKDVSEKLGLKKFVVSGIYQLAGKSVNKFIKSKISQWIIGGPNVIVLVDTYPEGCTNVPNNVNRTAPILCLAEAKEVPPVILYEALEFSSRNIQETLKQNKKKCLEIVETFVHPGSILIARRDSSLCSFDDLKVIESKFKLLVSNEGLSRHNTREQNLLDNLKVIWKEALDVCMAAEDYHHSLVQSFLFSHMWKRKYGQESYQLLLNEISTFVE